MSQQTDQTPLATYREHLPQVRRIINLFPDRVVVHAKWLFGRQYDQTIPLENLTTQSKQFWVRQRLFKRALAVGAMAIAIVVVCTRPGGWGLPDWAKYALYGVAILAAGVTFMSFPKVFFHRFLNKNNRPALDIAKAGPDTAQFDDFIEKVRKRIKKN